MNKGKKVLVINSHSINENTSTGITLRGIVDYFGNDEVLEVYYFPLENGIENNRIMSIKLQGKTKPLYNLISNVYRGRLKRDITSKITKDEINNSASLLKKAKKFVLAFDDWLEPNIKYNKKIIRMIKEFKPEAIYTLGASIFSLKLARYFSNELGIPVILHHMDNWRETTYSNSLLLRYPRRKLLKELSCIESRMNYGMTISDEMAQTYSDISGKSYLGLMHTLSNTFSPIKRIEDECTTNIVYAGGLHLERWKSLIEVMNAIMRLNDTGTKIKLYIYTKQSDREKYGKQFDSNTVIFNEYLPYNEVSKIYEFADILVHVESFDPEIVMFTKYSLSTKIPEYMASGRPILCYAPNTITSSKYINRRQCGISASNFEELVAAMEKLVFNKELREVMGECGIKTAEEKHSESYRNQILSTVFEIERA